MIGQRPAKSFDIKELDFVGCDMTGNVVVGFFLCCQKAVVVGVNVFKCSHTPLEVGDILAKFFKDGRIDWSRRIEACGFH